MAGGNQNPKISSYAGGVQVILGRVGRRSVYSNASHGERECVAELKVKCPECYGFQSAESTYCSTCGKNMHN